MLRLARFLSAYARQSVARIVEREVTVPIGPESVEGTLIQPVRPGVYPGWVVLHGITVPGRRHPVLMRFARALASTGGTVLVPEIPSWQRLEVDPVATDRIITAASRYLANTEVRPGGVGLVGFSFGATQALITASHGEARESLRSVVGFGGYCDLARTVRFMMVGEHEWDGVRYRADPDPYGRWIVAANFLTAARGYEGSEAVASAAREIAAEAGRRFVYAGDESYDALKREHRERLDPGDRDLWDVLAPPSGREVPREAGIELAERLVEAALAAQPELDPRAALPHLRTPVVLAHGRADLLIPFTETLRLATHLPDAARAKVTITRLFAHSRQADPLHLHEYPLETVRYFRLLAAALR